MNRIIIVFIAVFFISINLKAQSKEYVTLDPLAKKYFTPSEIDTMSQEFIKVQNYIVRYSYSIHRRWDKKNDSIVVFSRDTIDIRPFLISRLQSKPTLIYNVFPGLVIELDSKDAVLSHIKEIYSK